MATQAMSLTNWLKTGLKIQNFRGISMSYVVWSIEMSLTDIELGRIGLRLKRAKRMMYALNHQVFYKPV
jgi:hypothetical protein